MDAAGSLPVAWEMVTVRGSQRFVRNMLPCALGLCLWILLACFSGAPAGASEPAEVRLASGARVRAYGEGVEILATGAGGAPAGGALGWRAAHGAAPAPQGFASLVEPAHERVMITTSLSFQPAAGAQDLYLAGLRSGSGAGGGATALALIVEVRPSWFSTVYTVWLAAAESMYAGASASPVRRFASGEQLFAVRLWQGSFSRPVDGFDTLLAVDRAQGMVSFRVAVSGTGELVAAGHQHVRLPAGELYAFAGGRHSDRDRSQWRLGLSHLGATAGFERVGGLLGLADAALSVGPAGGERAETVLAGESFAVLVSGVAPGLPGAFVLSAEGPDGKRVEVGSVPGTAAGDGEAAPAGLSSPATPAAGVRAQGGPALQFHIPPGALPPGAYRLVVDYVDRDGYRQEVASHTIAVVSARVDATVRAGRGEGLETLGEVTLTADRDVQVEIQLKARAQGDGERVIFDEILHLPGGTPVVREFRVPPPDSGAVYVFELASAASPPVDLAVTYDVPLTLYVSPGTGSDEWSGFQKQAMGTHGPLRTVQQARRVMRDLREAGDVQGPVSILVLEDGREYVFGRPFLAPRSLGDDEAVIAVASVTWYGARGDGVTDDTEAFQAALFEARLQGGGVVFAPAGTYAIRGRLFVPEGVSPRGEWAPPGESGVQGTILAAYADRGRADGTPFITLEGNAAVKDLSIWYPEQSYSEIVPYPWTIGARSAPHNTVHNVTLVNSYQGIRLVDEGTSLHYLRNVYGTPLKEGIFVDFVTDVGRMTEIRFSPEVWARSGLPGAPATGEALETLRKRLASEATGITLARTDWPYLYDIAIEDYAVGIRVTNVGNNPPNGQMFGVDVRGANIGLLVEEASRRAGVLITRSSFRASAGENPVAVLVTAGSRHGVNRGVLLFHEVTFGGTPASALRIEGQAMVSVQNSVFENWTEYAVDNVIGTVTVEGSRFLKNGVHLYQRPAARNAAFVGNLFAGEPIGGGRFEGSQPAGRPTEPNLRAGGARIEGSGSSRAVVVDEPIPTADINYVYVFPRAPSPSRRELFVATDYGARGDGRTDDTRALQAALDAAGASGGGIVYVPAGEYRIDGQLTVPGNVELRGSWDMPHHSSAKTAGTVFLAFGGKGNEDGPPLIQLSPAGGVRGITVFYPAQELHNIAPYPWTVQSLGEGTWAQYVTLANSYLGMDFGTHPSAGHFVDWVVGSPLRIGLFVGRNDGEGWLQDVHFNPHYWYLAKWEGPSAVANQQVIFEYQRRNLDAFVFGRTEAEHALGIFACIARDGMRFIAQDGKGFKGVLIGAGMDATIHGFVVEQATDLTMINSELVSVDGRVATMVVEPTFDGRLRLFSTTIWGQGAGGLFDGSGEVFVQLLNHHGNWVDQLVINGGRFTGINLYFQDYAPYNALVGPGAEGVQIFGSVGAAGFLVQAPEGVDVISRGHTSRSP